MKTITKYLGITVLLFAALSCSKDDGTSVVPDSVEETPQPEEVQEPKIGEISPLAGPKGTVVTINGEHFGTDLSKVQVFFNEKEAIVHAVTNSKITTSVPSKANTGILKVFSDGTELVGPNFEYILAETLITTLAGSIKGDLDGVGGSAQFKFPTGTTVDGQGNVYVADSGNHRIRKITPDGTVSTFAGSTKGFEDGPATEAKFDSPYGVAIDIEGNIYVADVNNHKIRKITRNGTVSTLAGSTIGFTDGVGTAARFRFPRGVTVDDTGNVHVADTGNRRIRKISPNGTVSTPVFRMFNTPIGIAVGADDIIYLADSNSHIIWKIDSDGERFLLAGGEKGYEDGLGEAAQFSHPRGIAIDAEGNVFVSDEGNHKIRKISQDGTVSTTAGDLEGNNDGGPDLALFNFPYGLAVDTEGTIYIADTANHSIRKLTQE